MHTSVTSDVTIGQIASEYPLATRVFARHLIDYCCGGGRPLGEVCQAKGLDPAIVLDEIRQEIAPEARGLRRWEEAPLDDLIDHIVKNYHLTLQEELPRLEAMARKVVRVHGDKDPVRLPELLAVYLGLKAELHDHLRKEEQILFPLIRRGLGAIADTPVEVLRHEHEDAGAALVRLRELTDNYTVPEGACNTWRALWHGLEALERDLHEHIHLENNILFPRALASWS